MNTLDELKENLKKEIAGPNHSEGTCISCHKPFTDENVFTPAGWRETKISGMCEKCFDDLFAA